MQLFLDTANIDDIKEYSAWGVVDGVTTNPSLAAKEDMKYTTILKNVCKVVKGPVSAEVIAVEEKEMIKEGLALSKIAKNIYVKLPMTIDGLKACKKLSKKGVKINMTLIFSASQALLAAKAGAAFVSPFEGRLEDVSEDGLTLISEIVEIFGNFGFSTEVLAASIRSPRQVVEAAMAGADIATVPPAVFDKLIKHPLTDVGLAKFMSDWKKSKNSKKK